MTVFLVDECGGYLSAEVGTGLSLSAGWDNTISERWGSAGLHLRLGEFFAEISLGYDNKNRVPILCVEAGRERQSQQPGTPK
jgi:hypothetical protein